MKISTILFTSLIALAAVAITESASADDYRIKDRDGKVGTIRPGSGPVMRDATIHDRSGRKVGTIRAPSGPVMNHWTVKDHSGKTVGRIDRKSVV